MSLLTPKRLVKLGSYAHLSTNWHFLSAATLIVLNRPKEIPVLYSHVMEQSPKEQHAQLTAQFREGIFKTAALIGLPRVINGLTELKQATPSELRATELLREDKRDYSKEGEDLFARVYGKITRRVHGNLKAAYPDLDWFVQNFEYGPLLAHTSILDPKETSLVIIAALIPQDVIPQLKGHLKGAINNGATKEEVKELREMVIDLCSWYGITLKEVSKL